MAVGAAQKKSLKRPFTRPTTKPLDQVIAAFNKLSQPLTNDSALNQFLSENFAPAGGELEAVPVDQLQTNATFLNKLNDTVIKEFVTAVINIWPDLTRKYAGPGNCTDCTNSFIPVTRPFAIAGGRFREPYYWDSFWILQGLLRTGGSFTEISKNTIENFLDLVESIGFVPNGARVYYLNRSQPPLLSQMVKTYVEYTNDTSILERAVPLLIKEHEFWTNNRSVEVTTAAGQTYTLNRSAHAKIVREQRYRALGQINANDPSLTGITSTIISRGPSPTGKTISRPITVRTTPHLGSSTRRHSRSTTPRRLWCTPIWQQERNRDGTTARDGSHVPTTLRETCTSPCDL